MLTFHGVRPGFIPELKNTSTMSTTHQLYAYFFRRRERSKRESDQVEPISIVHENHVGTVLILNAGIVSGSPDLLSCLRRIRRASPLEWVQEWSRKTSADDDASLHRALGKLLGYGTRNTEMPLEPLSGSRQMATASGSPRSTPPLCPMSYVLQYSL
jgi:hypothetical protein